MLPLVLKLAIANTEVWLQILTGAKLAIERSATGGQKLM
jgi:hypothetical protein